MKILDKKTGKYKELRIKPGGDTLPIGTIVEYDGDTVPEGYEEVDISNSVSILTAYLPNYTVEAKEEFSTLQNYVKTGNRLSISNNSIVIGKGVSKISIDTNFNLQYNQEEGAAYIQCHILKNGEVITRNYLYSTVAKYHYLCCGNPRFLIDVEENDIITYKVISNVAGQIHNDQYGKSYITVEAFE